MQPTLKEVLPFLFDRVYVIAIARHQQRVQRLASQLADLSADFVVWSEGIDARQYTLDGLRGAVTETARRHEPEVAEINPDIRKKNLAIWLSHYAVREQIRKRGERALILEDDAWFVPDAACRLLHYDGELRSPPIANEWDLLYLYRENPASAIDGALRRTLGGTVDFVGGARPAFPVLPDEATREGSDLWAYIETGEGQAERAAWPRELIRRRDGSILDHVYRAASERISLCAYAISAAGVEWLYDPDTLDETIWTNDWWVARLTEPRHPIRNRCYCLTPCVVWPRPNL